MAQRVVDHGDLRKYRTEIPNIVLTLGLSPYELALYVHLKRTAGGNSDGVCWKSTATLARESGMSGGMVSKAKLGLQREFEALGKPLITVSEEANPKGGKPKHCITLIDIWQQNFRNKGSICDSLQRNVKPAETSSIALRLGDELNGVDPATPYGAAIRTLLMKLATDSHAGQSLLDSLAKSAANPEKLTTILSNSLTVADPDFTTWSSSAITAITTFATLARANEWSGNTSSLYELAVHCMNLHVRGVNFTSSPGEIKKEPLEERTLEERKEPSAHALLMELHASKLKGPLPDAAAQGGALKWLLASYAPDVLEACYRSQFAETWRAKVSWLTVKSEIGSWLSRNGNGANKQNARNGNPAKSGFEFKPKSQVC